MAYETTTNTTTNTNKMARAINVGLGIWLFISSFVWMHSASQFWNSLIVGAVVALFAIGAIRVVSLRFVNAAAAVWLFLSIWALPTLSSATAWNNGIVAAGIFIVSLIGGFRTTGRRERGHGREPLRV